jgi:hypothetical protein
MSGVGAEKLTAGQPREPQPQEVRLGSCDEVLVDRKIAYRNQPYAT